MTGKPKNRRNTDVLQGFLAMSWRKICRQDVRKVKGHSGDQYNDLAEQLARYR